MQSEFHSYAIRHAQSTLIFIGNYNEEGVLQNYGT